MNTQAETQAPSTPQTPPAGSPGSILGSPIFVLVAMLLLTWALFIRPQQRRDKEQKAMLSQIEKGDTIVTTGGIHARVTGVTDTVLTVEIAPNVQGVKLDRSAVASRVAKKADKS
ncbi:MAG TPA: preprotein translocase subunit YajC [Myxococcota bacterium]|nr:preprotein translocase subunit YajC [Myxococcota bacterium]